MESQCRGGVQGPSGQQGMGLAQPSGQAEQGKTVSNRNGGCPQPLVILYTWHLIALIRLDLKAGKPGGHAEGRAPNGPGAPDIWDLNALSPGPVVPAWEVLTVASPELDAGDPRLVYSWRES